MYFRIIFPVLMENACLYFPVDCIYFRVQYYNFIIHCGLLFPLVVTRLSIRHSYTVSLGLSLLARSNMSSVLSCVFFTQILTNRVRGHLIQAMESENHPSVDLKITQPGGLAPTCVPEAQWFPNTAGTGSLQHGLDLLKDSVDTLKHGPQAGCRMQSNFVWHSVPNEDVWITGHGVFEPRSLPRHVDRLL